VGIADSRIQAMNETAETGIKWWIRYVIVPLAGGAGVLGIVIAYISRPPVTLEKPSSPVVTSPGTQLPPKSGDAEAPKTTGSKPQGAVEAEDHGNQVILSIYNVYGRELSGKRVEIPRGEPFTIFWDGRPVEHQGRVVMESQIVGDSRTLIVRDAPNGKGEYPCVVPFEYKFRLLQELPTGSRELRSLDVVCMR